MLAEGTLLVRYTVTGADAVYAILFRVYKAEDLAVTWSSDGRTETELALGKDYSVQIVATGGAELRLAAGVVGGAVPLGAMLAIASAIPATQEADFSNTATVNTSALEMQMDREVQMIQQLKEKLGRAVVVPAASEESPEELLQNIYESEDNAAQSAVNAAGSATAAAGSASAADASAGAASGSAAAASSSAGDSAESAALAQAWAESETPPDPDDPESKSAKTWAAIAADVVPIATPEIAGKVRPDGTTIKVNAQGVIFVPAYLLTCATAGAVAVKEVELEGFSLTPGARLDVIFSEVNSAVTPMLSVNEGISKPILVDGVPPEVGDMAKNHIYTLAYTGSAWQIMAGMARDRIGQTVWFEDTLSRPGYAPLNGGTIENFSQFWPQMAAYLATAHGQARCFATLAEREAAHVAVWYTLTSGETVNWNGFGGVCKFFYDVGNDILYLPDLRGMIRSMAGDGVVAPNAGEAMGDRIRKFNLTSEYYEQAGRLMVQQNDYHFNSSGAWAADWANLFSINKTIGSDVSKMIPINIPIGAVNSPRSWGSLAHCYLGHPATA